MASRHKRTSAGANPVASADRLFRRGRELLRTGDLVGADSAYRQCLTADPRHGEAQRHLGLLAARRGDHEAAIAALERAVALLPDQAEAHGNLGLVLRHAGRLGDAVAQHQRASALEPLAAQRHHQLATTLVQAGAFGEAAAAFNRAAELDPGHLAARFGRAEALRLAGDVGEAEAVCRQALLLEPDNPDGLNTLGLLLDAAGDLAGADRCFRQAQLRAPEAVHLFVNRAHIAIKRKRLDEAADAVERALELAPAHPGALGNLGTIRKLQGRIDQALQAFSAAIAAEPTNPRHYSNVAALLVEIGQAEAAIAAAGIAIALAPNDAEAHFNLAVARRRMGQIGPAIAAYRTAYQHGQVEALVDLCHLRQQICDWAGLADEQALCLSLTYRQGRAVAPFSILTGPASPAEQQLSARVFAAGLGSQDGGASPQTRPLSPPNTPLRVGYLSSDFHEHATVSLIVGLIERHDRERFTCFGYSYGIDDNSSMRRRVAQAFDTFVDVRALGHRAVADRIVADGIDILIDLKGYTQDARTEIMALRPAPIQVNYLGYPGTMGASFIDYIVADRFIVPDEQRAFFDEAIVRLPHCYQPNDALRRIGAALDRRTEDLPDEGFVFCSFNNSYKITPAVFAIWMRLLSTVPGSVLWLLDAAPEVSGNLRREAAARGVAPDRLVFAPRIPADRYIARMALADLFLDTTPVTAHTTASEALWAGLPVLTCAGDSFVSRVAGSLLGTIGLPELVTSTLVDYEATALALARNPAHLATLRRRLKANRLTSPLFDIARYTRDFERALDGMASIHRAGRAPESFTVARWTSDPKLRR